MQQSTMQRQIAGPDPPTSPRADRRDSQHQAQAVPAGSQPPPPRCRVREPPGGTGELRWRLGSEGASHERIKFRCT